MREFHEQDARRRQATARSHGFLWLAGLALAIALAVVVAGLVDSGMDSHAAAAVRRTLAELSLRTRPDRLQRGLSDVGRRHTALGVVAGARAGWATARPGVARAFLISLSCLASLLLLELGSAGWRAWMHRLPSLPTKFVAAPPEECRIVVLGGSSALGEPYRPWLSVGQIVAWRLQQAFPGRRFACEILAWLGDSLEIQHHKLAALKRRPDVVIIYSGHNEFAARFEEERDGWLDEEPRTWLLQRAYRASLSSAFCRLVYEVISKNRLDSPAAFRPPSAHRSAAMQSVGMGRHPGRLRPAARGDRRVLRPDRRVAGLDRSSGQRSRLRAQPVHAAAVRAGARAAAGGSGISRSPRTRGRRAGGERRAGTRTILERHPGFAEAHFRLARLLEQRAG